MGFLYIVNNLILISFVINFNIQGLHFAATLNDITGSSYSPGLTWSGFDSKQCLNENVDFATFTVNLDMTPVDADNWDQRIAMKANTSKISEVAVGWFTSTTCPPPDPNTFWCTSNHGGSGIYDFKYYIEADGAKSHIEYNVYITTLDYVNLTQTAFTRYPYVQQAYYPNIYLNGTFYTDIQKYNGSLQEVILPSWDSKDVKVTVRMHRLEFTDFTFTLNFRSANGTVKQYVTNTNDEPSVELLINDGDSINASYVIHEIGLDSNCANGDWMFTFTAPPEPPPNPDPPGPCCCKWWCILLIVLAIILILVVLILYVLHRRGKRIVFRSLDFPNCRSFFGKQQFSSCRNLCRKEKFASCRNFCRKEND